MSGSYVARVAKRAELALFRRSWIARPCVRWRGSYRPWLRPAKQGLIILTGGEVDAAARIQLFLHTINIPEHPKFDDLLAISGEEGGSGPSDLSASRLCVKKSAAVQPLECHARCRPRFCHDQVFDDASVVR